MATRRLLAVHRWSGLFVSLNLLVFAVTGMILIFHEEIDDALGVMPRASSRQIHRRRPALARAAARRSGRGAGRGFIGLVILVSLVTGAIVYGPLMRHQPIDAEARS